MADIPEDSWWEQYLRDLSSRHTDWSIRDKVGEGNSAAVFRIETAVANMALKVYRPEFLSGASAAAERQRLALHDKLKSHRCGSLLRIDGVGDVLDSAYVLMEYVPWPSLDKVIGAVPSKNVPLLIRDVTLAALWLHEHDLVHRDIKPANILVSPDFCAAKLVDYGVIREIEPSQLDLTDQGTRRPFVATAQYSSPEYLFRLIEPSPALWEGLTIYQLGGVLHDLLVGSALFSDEVATDNRYVLAMAVLKKLPRIPLGAHPVRWAALARRALSKDLDVRLRSAKWQDFLNMDSFDSEAARRRLGLGAATQAELLADLTRQHEQESLLLKGLLTQLRDELVSRFRAEGYPRIQWQDASGVGVCARTSLAGDKYVFLMHITLARISANVEIRIGASIDAAGSASKGESLDMLWEGAQEDFVQSLSSEIAPLISDAFLKGMSEANDFATLDATDTEVPRTIKGLI